VIFTEILSSMICVPLSIIPQESIKNEDFPAIDLELPSLGNPYPIIKFH
jgi:hypothetical protein